MNGFSLNRQNYGVSETTPVENVGNLQITIVLSKDVATNMRTKHTCQAACGASPMVPELHGYHTTLNSLRYLMKHNFTALAT